MLYQPTARTTDKDKTKTKSKPSTKTIHSHVQQAFDLFEKIFLSLYTSVFLVWWCLVIQWNIHCAWVISTSLPINLLSQESIVSWMYLQKSRQIEQNLRESLTSVKFSTQFYPAPVIVPMLLKVGLLDAQILERLVHIDAELLVFFVEDAYFMLTSIHWSFVLDPQIDVIYLHCNTPWGESYPRLSRYRVGTSWVVCLFPLFELWPYTAPLWALFPVQYVVYLGFAWEDEF